MKAKSALASSAALVAQPSSLLASPLVSQDGPAAPTAADEDATPRPLAAEWYEAYEGASEALSNAVDADKLGPAL